MYKFGIAILMVLGSACGNSPDGTSMQQDDAHQHSNETTQTTLFSESTEFFIEYGSLEAGEESEFLVHVTDLRTYKPYLSGNVTVLLDGVSVTSGEPHEPGIFEIPFTPGKGGEYEVAFTLNSGAIMESVKDHVHIVQDHDELHNLDATSQSHTHNNDEAGEILFLKEQAWKSDFMVERILPVQFAAIIPTSGEIMAVPGEKKSVAANSQGIVHFSDRNLVQGSPVTKGQLLFTLSSETMIENNVSLQYQESLNRYENSQSEYERHKVLYAQGAISERQYISTRSRFRSDSLRFYSLADNTSKDGLNVYAPVSGTIHELNVWEGLYIETGQNLVTISANKKLMIRTDLSQQYYAQLRDIETANFRPAYTDQVYSIDDVNGKLLAAGSSVAENDHYLPIIFEVENDGSLLEGAYTEVFLKSSQKSNALVVPMSAIIEEQGEHYLYVQVTGESYTKRAVSIGRNDGQYFEITTGLSSGERVITKGIMLVKAVSMATGVEDHGHSH
ncbi:MAG: efflux RND transporter periplasmic adaptor subunit [Bacteroidota bacterium]